MEKITLKKWGNKKLGMKRWGFKKWKKYIKTLVLLFRRDSTQTSGPLQLRPHAVCCVLYVRRACTTADGRRGPPRGAEGRAEGRAEGPTSHTYILNNITVPAVRRRHRHRHAHRTPPHTYLCTEKQTNWICGRLSYTYSYYTDIWHQLLANITYTINR